MKRHIFHLNLIMEHFQYLAEECQIIKGGIFFPLSWGFNWKNWEKKIKGNWKMRRN